MKKAFISYALLIFAIFTIFTIGCSPTNKPNNGYIPDAPYIILPNDLRFTGWVEIEKEAQILIPSNDDNVDFNNLVVICSIFSYDSGSSFDWCEKNTEYVNTVKEGVKRINNGSEYFGPKFEPTYVYGTASNIEVYADTKLWGLEPGEDLSDYFELHPLNCTLISYDSAVPLAECDGGIEQMASCDLKMLSWALFPRGIIIQPKSIPEEQPQEVRFTVSITIDSDYTYNTPINRAKLSYQN